MLKPGQQMRAGERKEWWEMGPNEVGAGLDCGGVSCGLFWRQATFPSVCSVDPWPLKKLLDK